MNRLIFLILLLAGGLNAQVSHVPRNIQNPYTATDFWNNWESTNPRIALFILVTPQSFWTGVDPIGFTSNSRNMTLPGHPGITFYSTPGITPSAVEQSLGETTNLELLGVYQSGLFEQADVRAGKWNFAQVEVFVASWDSTAVNYGELVHHVGNLGEFKDYQTFFNAEGRGLIGRLSSDVGIFTQRQCRVKDFGDAQCGFDITGTTRISGVDYACTQTGVDLDGSYAKGDLDITVYGLASPLPPEGFFDNGKFVFESGPAEGTSIEIGHSTAGVLSGGIYYFTLSLKRGIPYQVAEPATTLTLIAGCTRTAEACRSFRNAANSYLGNIINFRAESFVPGLESINRITSSN